MKQNELAILFAIILIIILPDIFIQVGYNHLIPTYDDESILDKNIRNNSWNLATIGALNPSTNCDPSLYSERDDFLTKNQYNTSLSQETQHNYQLEYGNRSEPRRRCVEMKRAAAISIGFDIHDDKMISNTLPEFSSVANQIFLDRNFQATRKDALMTSYIGLMIWSDLIGSPGLILFEERNFSFRYSDNDGKTIYTYVSRSERAESFINAISNGLDDDLGFHRKYNIRNLHQGIQYASYYPYYRKLLIITNLDDSDNRDAIVSISGIPVKDKSVIRKFIVLNNVNLTEGTHMIHVENNGKRYEIPLTYSTIPFYLTDFSAYIFSNGILSVMIQPKVLANDSIIIQSLRITNPEFNIDCTQENANKVKLNVGDRQYIYNNCTVRDALSISDKRIMINGTIRYTEGNRTQKETAIALQVHVISK
jgi:hypothetical protein